MNKGIFRRFIGVGGLIMGVNVCYNLAIGGTNVLFRVLKTFVFFVFYFLLLNAGTVLLISLLYLKFYHKDRVNGTRAKFAERISLGRTDIKSDINQTYTSEIVKKGESKVKSKTIMIIELVCVLVLITLAIYGEYFVLFVIGPFHF
jgi:hypothetical protein